MAIMSTLSLAQDPRVDFALKICAGGLFLIFVQTMVSAVYCLFFHPLRRFPGPPLARVSRLWSRLGNFQGRKSERIHEAHGKYGG